MKDREIIEKIEYDEAFAIINNSSLRGKGNEPSCYLEREDGHISAELGWNMPKDARWFFFTEIAIALKECRAEGIKEGRKQLEEYVIKELDNHFKQWEELHFDNYSIFKEKLQKEADKK